MNLIFEMALERPDAIELCISLGEKFVQHFHRIMNEGTSSDSFEHHCDEMQAWWDKIRKIILKYNKKKISNQQLIDWFFTCGSSTEEIIDPKYEDLYNKFFVQLLSNPDNSISNVLIQIIGDNL